MAEGQAKPAALPELRPAAPHLVGPLGSSGAAPESPATAPSASPAAEAPPSGPSPDPTPAETTAAGAGDAAHEPPPSAEPTEPISDPAGSGPAFAPTADRPAGGADPSAVSRDDGGVAPSGPPEDATTPAGTETVGSAPAGAEPTAGDPPSGNEAGAGTAVAAEGKRRLLRRLNPVRGVRRVGRGVASWSRRPAGRLVVPAIIVVLLLGAAGTAGAYLVPQALQKAASPSATPGFPADGAAAPVPSTSLATGLPGGPLQPGGPLLSSAPVQQPGLTGQRPADALAGWAQQVGTKIGIPVVAVQAYGYAELVVARTTPACHLSWTTLAAIGKVESNHGGYNGSVLGADGEVQPPIYGLPLDGKGGRQLVLDTDHGSIDGDTTYDRAVGPMQFIPSTWLANKVDADNNGIADPNNINDASLTAAEYLCKGGRDMSKVDAWWGAILSYNAVRPYAQKVFEAANDYGQRSRV